MFFAVVREKKKFYIKEFKVIHILCLCAIARAIRAERICLESLGRRLREHDDYDTIRYSLCYDVILYLLNKTSNFDVQF